MSLSKARGPDGNPVQLPGTAPFPAVALEPLRGVEFDLPCEDPWVIRRDEPEHGYLEGADAGWVEYPDYMDFLDPSSPCHALKLMEREVYLHWWRDWLGAERVLDVGCGVGRFVLPFLDRGATVIGVDADIDSLRHCAWHAAGSRGRLDLHWSSAACLPEVEADVAIAAELLCYVRDPEAIVAGIAARLRPGGALLASVEARWGWATSLDAPGGGIEAALDGDGVLHVPGDRWVRTFEADAFRDLLEAGGLEVRELVATHYLTDGPLEQVAPEGIPLEEVLALEERCRRHRIWGPLNRAWTAVAVRTR